MAGSTWSTSKLRGYREVDGQVERLCRGCKEWFPLARLAKQPDCKFGRKPLCRPCDNARLELIKIRRELKDKIRRIDDGLLELRKTVVKAERERQAG
jgi:hypothetical protein